MDQIRLYAPIEKTDDEERMVYGYASTEAVDSQGEIVKKDALKDALADYMKFANIREMHQASAVGKAKKANIDNKGLYLAAKVVDDAAWKKVKEGVYNGFSIGGRVKTILDNEITGLTLSEISLVDRPANPEAVFDVWKADGVVKEEPKEKEAEKVEVVEMKKNAWSADFLIDLACSLSSYIYGEKLEGGNTTELETALKSIKSAAAMELSEDEDFPEPIVLAVEYAEKTLDLKKAEEKIEEKTEEKVEEAKEEEKKEEEIKEPEKEEVKEEVKEEPKEEVKETAEKTELEKIEDNLKAGKMPSDAELEVILKSQDIEVNQKNKDVMKFHLAGVIIKFIEQNMQNIENHDAEKLKAEKAQKETPIVVAEKKHQFDEVLVLVNKLEADLKKSTSSQVKVPPASLESPTSPAEKTNPVLELLRQAVELLTSQNEGNQLSPKQENTEENGSDEGSERTPGNRTSGHMIANPQKGDKEMKADMPEMKKFENEIFELKEQIKKLSEVPMPIKAKTSYATIEKFEKSDDAKMDLEKAEKRADELHELMKSHPGITAYEKEAQELAATIMRLRRETR